MTGGPHLETSYRGMPYRYYEYENGGDELGIEMNGGAFWERPGPRRGRSATPGRLDSRLYRTVGNCTAASEYRQKALPYCE